MNNPATGIYCTKWGLQMELTLTDITSIEIKTIRHSARKGSNWLKIILTDAQGSEHDIAIFAPLSGPDTVVTQTKK